MATLSIHGQEYDTSSLTPEQILQWTTECLGHFPAWQTRKYQVIYADPPWFYERSHSSLQGVVPYPSMTLDALKALPVGDVAAPDSLLLLWATNPLLPAALELIEAWGFKFVTVFK